MSSVAKRRTKKQKQNARNNLTVSWDGSGKSGSTRSTVKGEKNLSEAKVRSKTKSSKKSDDSAELANLGRIKRDIAKSVSVASLIIILELVIYWFWR